MRPGEMISIALILFCAVLVTSIALTDHSVPLVLSWGGIPTSLEEPSDVQKPYKVHTVPGRINFVDFDYGGEGFTYHDTQPDNQGDYAYRTDDADVDTGLRDSVDIPVIAHTYPGEWLQYSQVQVAKSGTYAATFYTSTTENGKSFSVLVDGKKVATVSAPNTGSWYTVAPTTVQLPLTAGEHTLRIVMDTGLTDLAYVEFAPASPTPTPGGEYGADANPTGNPISGGNGYTGIISRDDPRVRFIVDTRDELLSALQNARFGDIIYVEGNANIDMSGSFNVAVPAGVTIASNRGENGAAGGRIYQNRLSSDATAGSLRPLFITIGEGVRFTGLRIEGPDKGESVSEWRSGIRVEHQLSEIDNCEISGWGGAGIVFWRTGVAKDMKDGGYVHHNDIHNCQGFGFGYGVVVYRGSVCLVEANYFDYTRHSIAGDGTAESGYEARYNINGPHATYQNFDMHGKPDPSGSGTIAGDLIKIHHNTFLGTEPAVAPPIAIRGVPRVGAYIDHNWFYYSSYAPVWQMNGEGNISMTYNLIGEDKNLSALGPIRYVSWD